MGGALPARIPRLYVFAELEEASGGREGAGFIGRTAGVAAAPTRERLDVRSVVGRSARFVESRMAWDLAEGRSGSSSVAFRFRLGSGMARSGEDGARRGRRDWQRQKDGSGCVFPRA